MDLFSIVGACLRRWYITIPLLLLTGAGSYLAYQAVQPAYLAETSIVVLPSEQELAPTAEERELQEDPDPDNPYAGQGGSRFAVAVLQRNINSTAFEERLALDPAVEQSFEANASDSQPMVHIEATGPSAAHVYSLLDLVIEETSDVLNEFQTDAGATEPTRHQMALAVPAGPVEDVTPSRLRYAGAVGVLGAGLSTVLAVGLDVLLRRRAERRDQARAEREDAGAEAEQDIPSAEDTSGPGPDGLHASDPDSPLTRGELGGQEEEPADDPEPASPRKRSPEGVGTTPLHR